MKDSENLPAEGEDDLLPEYDLDFNKSKPNRFAKTAALAILLEPELAEIFKTPESVNNALRGLLAAMPTGSVKKQ